MVGLWGFHEAVADGAARAAGPTASCTVGNLLSADGTFLADSLGCEPFSLTPAMEGASGRVGGSATVAPRGQLGGPDVPVRMPRGERSAGAQTAVGQVVDPTAAADSETVVEKVTSATRPVVGLASPVVEEVAGSGLLEPVSAVVRPVTEPIVDVLPPALAPVLGLTQAIIGSPAAPSTPPAVDAPPSTDEAPAVAPPTAIVRPLPPIAAVYPVAPPAARTSVTASLDPRSPKAAGTSQVQSADNPVHALGLTRGAPASAAGQGSAAGGTGIPADASLPSWAPAVQLVGGYVAASEKLAGRSGQPDTRPA
ncbi:hypothetical protein [Micromonospora sp. 4G55]|uniref:hypothetical protein n=1 Tax=Micromonospora sp. 4G55 TaxID=2806102 RepID=UPI001A48FEC7|nr:hypothetical protein [Micromonospora sp. 4G55]MBM0255656.1 hypothetical protein [Micromonospora sp. 4G55]